MERRLPAADEDTENRCIGETDALPIPSNVSPVLLAAEELEKTSSLSHKGLVWTTENRATKREYTETPVASKDCKVYKTMEVNLIKAKRSQSRILALSACISYVLFHCLGVDLGVRLIAGYAEPRLHQAEVQLQAVTNGLIRERLLHVKLDSLLDTTMGQCYTESYENCLVRGLYKANAVFLGMDFTQYPDVRNPTVEWIASNCGKIMHAPQLFAPETSKDWVQTVSRLRWLAEKAFELFRYNTALLWCGWTKANPRLATKSPLAANPVVTKTTCKTASSSKISTEVPFGFTLDCGESLCRLVYIGPSNSTIDGQTLKQALVKAHKDIRKWTLPSERVIYISSYVISLLSLLQLLFGAVSLLMFAHSQPQSRSKLPLSKRIKGIWLLIHNAMPRLEEDKQLIINAALYALLRWELAYTIPEFGILLLPVGTSLCAFHALEILAFFDPVSSRKESMRSFWRSIKELYLIVQGHNLPRKTPLKRSYSGNKSTHPHANGKPASMIALRFISPLTSFSEDIQQELKAMHMDQGNQPSVNFYPETSCDTDPDSEDESNPNHASFIDLISDTPPAILEYRSEWFVVEE